MKTLSSFKRRAKYDHPVFVYDDLAADNIDKLSLDMVAPNQRVLELGCATGYHTQYLVQAKNCTVTGVDLDTTALKYAKTWAAKTVAGNLDDEQTWQHIRKTGRYSLCFASNVIEHLLDPWQTLKQIHSVLEKNGELVVVVPNIAWWRSRLKLLQGKWEYEEYGLFDKTHTKFFTLPALRKALVEAGFEIKSEAYDPAGGAKFLTPILKLFPNAYAYQIAIKAKKISV